MFHGPKYVQYIPYHLPICFFQIYCSFILFAAYICHSVTFDYFGIDCENLGRRVALGAWGPQRKQGSHFLSKFLSPEKYTSATEYIIVTK